jgi:hypothetical protein
VFACQRASLEVKCLFPALVPVIWISTSAFQNPGGSSYLLGVTAWETISRSGLPYWAKNNVRFSLDMGPQIWHHDNNNVTPSFSIRLGKAF